MAAAQKDRSCNPAAAARQDKALNDLISARNQQDAAWSFKPAAEACTTQTVLHPPTVLSVLQQSRQNATHQRELQ
jgi:hypothetical protein